jgi:AcrR family transcriptional regulator
MTKKAPRDKRIADIINAAVQEFVEKGYETASMESISERAGLTKGGLYHYFSGKDDVLLAANACYMEPVYKFMLQAKRKKSPSSGLRFFIRTYLKHWARHPREITFTLLSLTKMLTRTDLWPSIAAYTEEMIAFYQNLLELGISRGELRPHDTRGRALAMLASLDGITAYMIMSHLSAHQCTVYLEHAFLDDIARSSNEQ